MRLVRLLRRRGSRHPSPGRGSGPEVRPAGQWLVPALPLAETPLGPGPVPPRPDGDVLLGFRDGTTIRLDAGSVCEVEMLAVADTLIAGTRPQGRPG